MSGLEAMTTKFNGMALHAMKENGERDELFLGLLREQPQDRIDYGR